MFGMLNTDTGVTEGIKPFAGPSGFVEHSTRFTRQTTNSEAAVGLQCQPTQTPRTPFLSLLLSAGLPRSWNHGYRELSEEKVYSLTFRWPTQGKESVWPSLDPMPIFGLIVVAHGMGHSDCPAWVICSMAADRQHQPGQQLTHRSALCRHQGPQERCGAQSLCSWTYCNRLGMSMVI